ncbi:MAG: hypothetical protein CL424_17905 [Acidimicrobiaceae bacterium]|nr:hypothetical protein [Acidimicrobiaceae bacterium]
MLVPARQRSVEENLRECFPSTSDMPFLRSDLIGSASNKNTVVRPFTDTDVLARFSNERDAWVKYQNDSKAFLYRVRNAYDGVETKQVGARGQAVRVFFESGGHVDVAPVFFEDEDTFWLPAGDGTWIKTSPLRANRWFLERQRSLGGDLRRLVRFVKKWNKAHSSHFSSYHLETIVATVFRSLGDNRRKQLALFFEHAGGYLHVDDPGGQSGDLAASMTLQQEIATGQALASARDRADRALAAESVGDHSEAKRLWRIILGDEFPD